MTIDFNRTSRSLAAAWLFLIVFFALLVVFPLVNILLCVRAEDFATVFTRASIKQAAHNTLIECVFSTTISVLVGYIFAYAVVRTNIPGRRFFALVPVFHLVTPPFVGGLAFILLMGRQGFITKTLLHLNVSLYGLKGLVIAQVLCFFPMAYLICAQSLASINPNLEKAAVSMGASPVKVFFTVILPLSFSGFAASFLFVAVNVLSDFGNPLVVAGRFRVLSVEMYAELSGWLNVGPSAVMGLLLVLPSVALFLLQNRFFKNVSAKVSDVLSPRQIIQSSAKKSCIISRVLLTVFVGFVTLCIFLQIAAIVAGSFQKVWGINTAFTLSHIKDVWQYNGALLNSLLCAFVAACLSTMVAVLSAFVVGRTNCPLRPVLDSLSQLPSALPGTMLGLSFAMASNRLKFNAPELLIILSMTVSFLPFSYRIVTQSFAGIKTTLDDGAQSLGANKIRTLRTVLAPISYYGIASGFVYDFIRGVGTLSAVVFLVSFNAPLVSVSIVNRAEEGDWGTAASLSLVLMLLTFLILILGRLLLKLVAFIKQRRG